MNSKEYKELKEAMVQSRSQLMGYVFVDINFVPYKIFQRCNIKLYHEPEDLHRISLVIPSKNP